MALTAFHSSPCRKVHQIGLDPDSHQASAYQVEDEGLEEELGLRVNVGRGEFSKLRGPEGESEPGASGN